MSRECRGSKMFFMTPEEVREKLGLKVWEDFLSDPMHRLRMRRLKTVLGNGSSPILDREKNRQTGRSTRVICNAIAALSRGLKIRIRAGCFTQEKLLLHSITGHAQNLGVICKGLIARRRQDSYDLEIFDHSFWEP